MGKLVLLLLVVVVLLMLKKILLQKVLSDFSKEYTELKKRTYWDGEKIVWEGENFY